MYSDRIEAIGGQATVLQGEVEHKRIDRRQTQFGRESKDQFLVGRVEGAWRHEEAAVRFPRQRAQHQFETLLRHCVPRRMSLSSRGRWRLLPPRA